jgi:hypothetical protein
MECLQEKGPSLEVPRLFIEKDLLYGGGVLADPSASRMGALGVCC